MRYFFLIFLFLLLSGCSLPAVKININPQVTAQPVVNAHQIPVVLKVSDQRGTTFIGNRGFYLGGDAITSYKSFPDIIESNIKKILQNNRFVLSKSSPKTLDVNIILLYFHGFDQGYPIKYLYTDFIIQVIATNHGRTLTKTYADQDEIHSFTEEVSNKQVEDSVNPILSKVLNDIANDRQLWDFLRDRYHPKLINL